MKSRVSRVDNVLFRKVAGRRLPGADRVLPRLSRSANHGLLWFGTAAAIATLGSDRASARRAALRGTASLALASLVTNTLAKRAVRRDRPLLGPVPSIRHLKRQPHTTSFPSGHSASAAAFATGVAMESPALGAVVAPVAAAVAFSRVYTGVHYPTDVAAGIAIGAGAALVVRRLLPSRQLVPPPVRASVRAPRLPDGAGLVVVANSGSGPTDEPPEEVIGAALPEAEVMVFGRDGDEDLPAVLSRAAKRAAQLGGALGVFGGDGTVGAAAGAALEEGLPLAVLPGGTLNHFAHDLGISEVSELREALASGEAVEVDLARFGEHGTFVNTFALGVYPELVRVRERWSPRIGSWPAGVVAAWQVLREYAPAEVHINGSRHRVWLLFAGNCRYDGLGLAPQNRSNLADGLLDVRVAYADHWARTRLLAGALAGTLQQSPVHGAALLRRLRIDWIEPGTQLAHDGEVTDAPRALTLSKAAGGLTVYCPQTAPDLTGPVAL
ncbi:phosphatase PAP2 family protein [Streptomyces sp. XM4193]|uniref:bifunctional phosphatase PAP2/diacylglycerol kinase family protein n=1 Tax=Streptomyces sp. XM4193 TaxID=2929782 RepID=UPI001FF7CFEB|nr:bifunctional phosphatase PAP2/diacylglycerol kinase family protein [Streptomyces sp. XM4193]MCK1797230.1 phosphatase PAP2 family protein [Streptomyces sp. XM4193]